MNMMRMSEFTEAAKAALDGYKNELPARVFKTAVKDYARALRLVGDPDYVNGMMKAIVEVSVAKHGRSGQDWRQLEATGGFVPCESLEQAQREVGASAVGRDVEWGDPHNAKFVVVPHRLFSDASSTSEGDE